MTEKIDSVFRMRSLGVAAPGIPDQYADGMAAKVWQLYIGDKEKRTSQYRKWLTSQLRKHGCRKILDVACGTGVDSIMLLEEGFEVVSCDASDKMLKYALKERWNRRKEAIFDKWVIEEANWLSLSEDLEDIPECSGGFDAVLCLGNSFAHLPDFEGDQSSQKEALSNFVSMVRPGGMLLVDHRNYDAILDRGSVPVKNVYYDSDHIADIKVSNLYVNGQPSLVTLDYFMDVGAPSGCDVTENGIAAKKRKHDRTHHFRLSYYPHRLESFKTLLEGAFKGTGASWEHRVFGDFAEYRVGMAPAYFLHMATREPA